MRIAIPLLVGLALWINGSVTAASSGGVLLVVNKGDRALGIVDPETGKQVATVQSSGITGHEVIASPDGKTAYVPIYGDSGVGRPGSDGRTLDVIDIASRKLVATIDFGKAQRPHCPLFGKDGRLYVTTEITNSVTVIDPKTNQIVDSLPTGQPESHMLALTRDGKRAYTSNVGGGTVSVIDLTSKQVVSVIPVSTKAQRIALSIDDKSLFTADQAAKRLAVIDTTTLKIRQWVDLPGLGYGTAPTPDGRSLVVAIQGVNQVGILDLASLKLTHLIDVPKVPQQVLLRPDGRFAYVSCDQSRQVAVIDIAAGKLDRLIDAGAAADGLAWAATKP